VAIFELNNNLETAKRSLQVSAQQKAEKSLKLGETAGFLNAQIQCNFDSSNLSDLYAPSVTYVACIITVIFGHEALFLSSIQVFFIFAGKISYSKEGPSFPVFIWKEFKKHLYIYY